MACCARPPHFARSARASRRNRGRGALSRPSRACDRPDDRGRFRSAPRLDDAGRHGDDGLVARDGPRPATPGEMEWPAEKVMTMHNVQADGASIPSLGFGTWAARGDECAKAVAWALESGYRHIDTAAVYANEEAVEGDTGLARSTLRHLPHHQGRSGRYRREQARAFGRGEPEAPRVRSCRPFANSLADPRIPLKHSLAALGKAKRRGLTKHIGVSNFTPRGLSPRRWRCRKNPSSPINANTTET